MMKLINHWYWGRAQAGAYSIVASYITAEATYGSTELPIFMLAKDGAIVADRDVEPSLAAGPTQEARVRECAPARIHLRDEGVEPVAPDIAGPDEVLTGDVQVALGELRVVASVPAAGIEVRHDRRNDQYLERRIEAKTHDLVGARKARASSPASS